MNAGVAVCVTNAAQLPRGRWRTGLASAILVAGAAHTARAQWSVVDLNPPAITRSVGWGAGVGQQVGWVFQGGTPYAALWSGSSGTFQSLHPQGLSYSQTLAASEGRQVGAASYSAVPGAYHASLWSGSAGSWIDLHPEGTVNSVAWDLSGTQQVGQTEVGDMTHAVLWTGTANSWIDLHPPGASASVAYAVSEGRQSGAATIGMNMHAGLWSGSATSFVDLHPASATRSTVQAMRGDQQVGWATIATLDHAGFWRGSASSWVDLHPSGTTESRAYGVAGGWQFGYARVIGPSELHASAWSGTAGSWIDLHAFLPAEFTSSEVHSAWADCDFVYAVGFGATSGDTHALIWTLPICAQPVAGVQPAAQSVCADAGAQFAVVFVGACSATYHWRLNGEPIDELVNPSATSAVLTLEGVSAADEGAYDCIVSGACGVVASSAGTLALKTQDFNVDGNADQGDIDTLIDIVAGGSNPGGLDPDLNNDGAVDQGDVDALINWIAGGSCPG